MEMRCISENGEWSIVNDECKSDGPPSDLL